jgi:signal transduction histidine kinase
MPTASPTPRVRAGSVGWLLAIFVSSAIALFALLYWLTSGYLLHEVDERLRGEVAEFHSIGRAEAISSIAALSRRDIANSRPYGVFDSDRSWLAGNVAHLPDQPDRTPFNYTQTYVESKRTVEGHYRGIIVPTTSGVRIVVGHSIDEIIEFDRTLVKTLCAGVLLTILLAIACGAALNRISNRRIRALSDASREIMGGKLDRRLPTRGRSDDLDRLASIVNTMLDEIERLVQEVRGVCAGIAHDLRTPMTQLRAGLERAGRRARTTDDYAQAVESAIVQSDVVLNRFTALLRIAEIEAGGRRASFAPVSLNQVLRDVVDLYEPLAVERGVAMTLDASTLVEVTGDVDLLFGAVENLLDNALKFTPRGGSITLSAEQAGEFALLRVNDTGPGIDPAEREAVLRPFYRSRANAAQATPGHGLGLSLVAAIARVHGADIVIGDSAPGCAMLLRFRERATVTSGALAMDC